MPSELTTVPNIIRWGFILRKRAMEMTETMLQVILQEIFTGIAPYT